MILVCGPCVIESEDATLFAAQFLKNLVGDRCQLYFKSSFDKANRSSVDSYRGPGLKEGLRILQRVKEEFDLPIFTDVHTPEQAVAAAEVCDVIQIPAFLSRQTDLLVAAGQTDAIVNVKKGQFMAPWEMQNVVKKIGSDKIWLTDRGTTFGYQNLVSDFRSIPIMQELGFPVLYDATHSVQLPAGEGNRSGGDRRFIPTLSKAAIAAGCDGIYAEAHPDPKNAKCDQACQLPFSWLETLLESWLKIHEATQPCCALSY
ncbi:MAG: 2-dehydro-3-deoxyphosphooctonate aldolase [Chlamydiales bacterium]|nr:2-dehydro-3-deoxyphosphooctonate aldolase [Chlamydiales bacterium]MCH9635729.1 2-dehydro-3-deoxyphosphooctonate aldolase [Chlamydiales bacterium]MCH9704293.1 3-deoxy-8-phosphooctulonate synthase [Chlamydiota bacterium]